MILLFGFPVFAYFLLGGGILGLTEVPTGDWGGFSLTLVIAITGIVASLPLGILLALGRRSEMPVLRLISTLFIEFWRGVPLITVLFMSSFMLPLFAPKGADFDQLLRALIGVALFSSAYMAEVVRGGLQAIPKGQYEGAQSLGLSFWKMMGLIVMPQALKIVIPGIVQYLYRPVQGHYAGVDYRPSRLPEFSANRHHQPGMVDQVSSLHRVRFCSHCFLGSLLWHGLV